MDIIFKLLQIWEKMKKHLIISITVLLIISILLSGCTQENNNNDVITDEVELVSSKIETNPSNTVMEVFGTIKNNGNRTIDQVVVEVFFFNKDNEIIHSGTYTVYNFVNGYTADFFVDFRSTEPNYDDYDHYSIELQYD